jgi:hypothetical protein
MAHLGTLPHDPLRDLAKGEEINLPYTAFCYLIRRPTVRCFFFVSLLPSWLFLLPLSPLLALPSLFLSQTHLLTPPCSSVRATASCATTNSRPSLRR